MDQCSSFEHAVVINKQPVELIDDVCDMIIIIIWGFTSLSTLYRSYHDG